MAAQTSSQPTKLCFVTVGATASFEPLLRAVLDQSFLLALQQSDYTHLLVQYGKDGQAVLDSFIAQHPIGSPGRHGIEIAGFDFNQAGLVEEMRMAKEDQASNQRGGMIVSHAGVWYYYPSNQELTP